VLNASKAFKNITDCTSAVPPLYLGCTSAVPPNDWLQTLPTLMNNADEDRVSLIILSTLRDNIGFRFEVRATVAIFDFAFSHFNFILDWNPPVYEN
jgi:hypothetical protein